MLKNDSRLAALPKTAEFQIVSVFENTLKTEYKNPGRLFAGRLYFIWPAPNTCSIYIYIYMYIYIYTHIYLYTYQFKRTEHKSPNNTEVKMLLQKCGIPVQDLLHGTFLRPKLAGESWVFGKFVYSFSDDRQLWHWKIICIYTTTFPQIAHYLGLNLRFVFEFGELHRYKTLLDYQESSSWSRHICNRNL